MKKILVCGDRNWHDWPTMVQVLQRHITCDDVLIHGDARGADSMADRIGREQIGCEVRIFIADWNKYGKAAGPIRNRQMLDEKPDLVIAFHYNFYKSKGTRDTVDEAQKRNIPWILISESEPALRQNTK